MQKDMIQNTILQTKIVGLNGLDRQSLPVETICVLMKKFWSLSARLVPEKQLLTGPTVGT